MDKFLMLHGLLCYSLLFLAGLRPSESHTFVCLDTVSLCNCDPAKLSMDCSNLRFRAVPLADIPNETSSLGFGGNFVTAVLADTFATLGSLLRLSLENNVIGYVESWSFDATKELRYLDLSGNRLATVPSALSVLTSLRVLNLSGNGLSYLSADDFKSFTKLETLRLENNELYSISEIIFHPLANLHVLYLDGNFISSDPIGWFTNSTRLTQLRMGNNFIALTSSVEDWFGVEMQVLPMEELHLDNNVIQEISAAAFSSCVNMKELHLGANEIMTIAPSSFGDLTKLQNLTLNGNLISGSFPTNLFLYTESLISLSLEGNSLSEMSRDAFNGLSQIQDLNLAGNKLVHLFTCGDGDCEDSEAESPLLPAVRSLFLQSNSLTHVPDVRNFFNLENLDLSDNSIVHMEPYVFNGTSMRLLFLHDNMLTTMSLANFQFLPALEAVTITGNPWTCDCYLFWIVDPDAERLAWKTAVHEDVVCKAPDFAEDLDLRTLYYIAETARKRGPFADCETVSWLTIVIIIAVWVFVVFLALVCYFTRRMNYGRGYFARTMKTKVVKAPPAPSPTPPLSAACLNKGATFDELDKTTDTNVTCMPSARDDDQTSQEEPITDAPSNREQCEIKENPDTNLAVTVISIV